MFALLFNNVIEAKLCFAYISTSQMIWHKCSNQFYWSTEFGMQMIYLFRISHLSAHVIVIFRLVKKVDIS